MIEGHGDDSYKYPHPLTADFSSNVYPYADLTALKAHLCGQMHTIGHYPEPEPYTLEARIAEKSRLPGSEHSSHQPLSADSVCATNGATEAIYLIAQTFGGTNTAILQPTFSEYADACRMHGHRVTSLYQLPASDEASSAKESSSLRYRLPAHLRMLWLCNPNNPTGSVLPKSYLAELIRANPEVCFVIDQSYEYFTLQPLFTSAEAAEFPNVLLLHSMTKSYAIPGLRLGYITGSPALIRRLRTHRQPWSVNQLAIQAGLYLLQHDVPRLLPLPAYLHEAARLRQALLRLGFLEVWPTETHFMLVRLRLGRASALKDYLANSHGILIRDASNFDGLDERFFRIATQTAEENDRLVKAIEQWIADN